MTVRDGIQRRLKEAVSGWAFTPADLLDLGSPQAVGMALLRLLRAGQVRRLRQGIYDVPRTHPRMGALSPDPHAIAAAIARRDGATLHPAPSMAANLLRLSDQVPARVAFVTDGPSRKVVVGRQTIELRHQGASRIRKAAPISNLVISALREIGRANVTRGRIAHLRHELRREDRLLLLRDVQQAPVWMHVHLRFIAGEVGANSKPPKSARPTRRAPRGGKT